MIFDQNSYQTHISDPSMLDLPDLCTPTDLPKCKGICDKYVHFPNQIQTEQ